MRYHLLYSSKTGGKINELLKKRPNNLLLILTKEDHTIAVYSSLSYCETVNMKETKGLVISTNSKNTYSLKVGINPIKNNKEYIVVGNDEISISKNVTNDLKMKTKISTNSAFGIGS